MSKDKDAFKKAMNDLHTAVLDDDQREALAVVERYAGELRRQAAELKAEVSHLQKSLVASEEHVARLQQLPQEVARLEEGLRASGNRVDMLEAQVTTLRQHLPDPIPKDTKVLPAATILSTNALRMFDYTLKGCEYTRTTEIAYFFGLSMMLRVCQFMAKRTESDSDLEKELSAACRKYLDRVAPGKYQWGVAKEVKPIRRRSRPAGFKP